MKTATVKIPEGHEIDQVDKSTGKVTFKPLPKDMRSIIKGWDDILKLNGETDDSFKKRTDGWPAYLVGHEKEILIVSAYNQGVKPDFTDGTYKYCPWFNMPSPSGVGFSFRGYAYWHADSSVGARQLFVGPDAKANMLDAVKKFLPEYKESRTL